VTAGLPLPSIRTAEASDAGAIRRVHLEAFGRPEEADLVDALVAAGEDVVSLVSVVDEAVVGHVLLSRVHVGEAPLLALAPLGVLPGHKSGGHGRALVRAALDVAQGTPFPAVVVLGSPSYYGKLGFEPARRLGLKCPWKVPRESWRAARLPAWVDGELRGTVRYPAAFDATT
jgi:predicted N-acetyltransferase YhbS